MSSVTTLPIRIYPKQKDANGMYTHLTECLKLLKKTHCYILNHKQQSAIDFMKEKI